MAPARCFSGRALHPSRHLHTELGVSASNRQKLRTELLLPGVTSGRLKRAAATRSPPQAAEEQGGDAPGPESSSSSRRPAGLAGRPAASAASRSAGTGPSRSQALLCVYVES